MRESLDAGLTIWVIYERPWDYPNNFVARAWEFDKPTEEILLGDSLEEVRQLLPAGLFRMPRAPTDDPVIVETWL